MCILINVTKWCLFIKGSLQQLCWRTENLAKFWGFISFTSPPPFVCVFSLCIGVREHFQGKSREFAVTSLIPFWQTTEEMCWMKWSLKVHSSSTFLPRILFIVCSVSHRTVHSWSCYWEAAWPCMEAIRWEVGTSGISVDTSDIALWLCHAEQWCLG